LYESVDWLANSPDLHETEWVIDFMEDKLKTYDITDAKEATKEACTDRIRDVWKTETDEWIMKIASSESWLEISETCIEQDGDN
jgi:hypothetical protein